MQYLILSDIHLGCTTPDMIAKLQILLAQNVSKTVIWNGDIIDLLMFENSYQVYDKFIRDTDIRLKGNHDYVSDYTKHTILGDKHKTFISHGDLVDFGLGFSLLENLSFNTVKMLLRKKQMRLIAILLLLRLCKRWSLNDCDTFFTELINLSDDDIGVFHHSANFKLKHFKAYANTFIKLVRAKSTATEKIDANKFSYCLDSSKEYWGLMTHSPELLLERTLLMYPESRECDTIVIGHIHHKADKVIKASNGKEYRFIITGAWVGDVVPSYIELDTSTNQLEVKEITQ